MTIEFDELKVAGGAPRRGRGRIVAAVAAAMLVAAAGGVGYGIGRSVDRRTPVLDSGAGGDAAASEPAATEDSAPPDAAPRTSAAVPPATIEVAPSSGDIAAGGFENADVGLRSSGGPGYAAFGPQPMDLLYERTTDTGFALRVRLGQTWEAERGVVDWGAGDWRPAPWCFESGQVRVSMTGNGIVDVGGASWFAEPFEGRAVSWLTLGGNDGDPHSVIVVQAPAETTNVRATFADGSTDAVAPQGGMAVLIGPGAPPTPVDEGGYTYWVDSPPSFEVTFEGGAEPVTIGSDGQGQWDDPEFRASCTPPPPALPDAGEQPADAVAAEADIRAAMAALYGAIDDGVERSDFIDDPTGVAEARTQVQEGDYADDAAAAEATIDELVFTAPDEAWFRYSIDTPGNDFDNRYGIAVSVEGVWKITRATVCQDLSLAGGDCGAGWEPIIPPSVSGRLGD